MVIKWSPIAKKCLKDIYSYYKERSLQAAENIRADINTATKRLADFPLMAPIEPLLAHRRRGYRALLVRKRYKVIYYIANETIHIAFVWDCRRNPAVLIHEIDNS
jgi:plasmid stabilization system protein ParE